MVITKPRNIQSQALHPGHYNSTIGHTINPFPEYFVQGYGKLQKNEYVDRQKWNKFYDEKRGGKKFKSTCYPKAVINPDNQFYGLPDEYNRSLSNAKMSKASGKQSTSNQSEKKPFKPSNPMKSGEQGYITNFIRLEPKEGPKGPGRKRPTSADKLDKKPFKYIHFIIRPARGYLSRPTPSITLHMSNIRSSLVR